MVFQVVGNLIYRCPEHGEFKQPVINGDQLRTPAAKTWCPWAEYNGWRERVSGYCEKDSEYVRSTP